MPSVSGEIGSLVAGSLRNAIEQAKYEGRKVDIWIGKGFLSKPFTIKYDDSEAQNVIAFLKRYVSPTQQEK